MTSSDLVLCGLPIKDPIPVLFVSVRDEDHAASSTLVDLENCCIQHAFTCAEAIDMLRQHPYPVVVTDRTMPDGTWLDIQHASESQSNPSQVIVLAAAGDHAFWADALLQGALDALYRPLSDRSLSADIVVGYRRWSRSAELIQAQAESLPAANPRVIPITQFQRDRRPGPEPVGKSARKVIWRGQTRVAVHRAFGHSA